MKSVLLSVVAGIAFGSGAWAAEWTATAVPTPQPVTAVRQVGADVFVEAGGFYKLVECGAAAPCLVRGTPPPLAAARDGIPDGSVAAAGGEGIVAAYFSEPTGRYDHGILGDRIEGGALVAFTAAGARLELRLDAQHVFEDIAPRIADLDGDRRNDIVAIRSAISAGAGVAVYSVVDGGLREIASIPPIGIPHRWLNIAGIADFNGDGRPDIALVKTPHIGGRLELWTLANGRLVLLDAMEGFSNHAIGSTILGMSGVADVNRDGIVDLAVPSADRSILRVVSAGSGRWQELGAVRLPAPAVTAIGVWGTEPIPIFVLGTRGGELIAIREAGP